MGVDDPKERLCWDADIVVRFNRACNTTTHALEQMNLKRYLPRNGAIGDCRWGEAKATQPAAGSRGTEPFKIAVISAQIHAKKPCFLTEIPGFPGFLFTNWKMGGFRKKAIRHLV